MSDNESIRSSVSETYTRAVAQPAPGTPDNPESKALTARVGGYRPEELQALPADAVVNSFGCGNPVAMSGLREGDTVLDLGSGAGIDLILAARKVGPRGRVIGVDMTDAMIARARENVRAAGLANVEVRKGIIEQLPVESGSVDWVISNCVINLSPEKERVFAEIARVLKPGGQMLVSDIVVEQVPPALRRNVALYASCIAGAVGEGEFLAGLRAAGMVEVEVRDRLVYDESQFAAFLDGDQADLAGAGGCGCGASLPAELVEAARSLVGKIWSAKVYARKR